MLHYCINMIGCSAVLFLFYKILLEKEKMHVFKRFYLLFSIIASFTVPLITISFSEPEQYSVLEYIYREPVHLITGNSTAPGPDPYNPLPLFITIIYLAGLTLCLIRLLNIISRLIKKSRLHEPGIFHTAKLVLTEEKILPHSFLNTIFLNKEDYREGKIEQDVLVHELAHVKGGHSWDILAIHLIQCIFWFNPVYIFYRRSIQLNHEFLADEAVLHASGNPEAYQHLLIYKAVSKEKFSLVSPFNYSIIKKRLVMITKNTSPQILLLKKVVIMFLFLATAFLFTTKETIAQQTRAEKNKTEVPSTKDGAPDALVQEYATILAPYKTTDGHIKTELFTSLSKEKKDRLYVIYTMMNQDQQNQELVGFRPKESLRPKKHPTDEQLTAWADPGNFVRIDGRKIKNEQLSNYSAADFDNYDTYKPNKGSTDYGRYNYQVNLMTKKAYASYAKSWEERSAIIMVVFNKKFRPLAK